MIDEATRVTDQAYEALAARYRDRWHDVDPLVEAKRDFAQRLPSRGRLLDVGCGTGRDLAWFATHGLQVLGLDRSSAMLAFVPRPAPLLVADVRRIPLAGSSVDGWWASATLLHLDPAGFHRALAELARVTRPSGAGFLSMKEGTGTEYKPVDDGPHARFFCYWQSETLDAAIRAGGWQTLVAWTSRDALGRMPWLCRIVRPRPPTGLR